LTEIVTPDFAREFENGQKLNKAFDEACEKRPEIALKFSDALIHVGFIKKTPIRQRLLVVPLVADLLVQNRENSLGYIQIPQTLGKIVSEIAVRRGVVGGPAFDIMDMTKRTEEIFRQFDKKCTAKYSSGFPIELLAYYVSQPSSDNFDWQYEFHERKRLSDSPFERVWVFDNWCKSIKYVYPSPE
jgi:hypothetical protein